MLDYLHPILFWHWLGFAAFLLIFEVLTGSGFLLWIGLSAALMSLIVFIFPALYWGVQLLGFALLAILAAVGWWTYLKFRPISTDRPTLNRRGEQYIDRIFTLDFPVVNGMGKIHVDDSIWRIRCVDLPAGARVKIVGVDGVILNAEPVSRVST